MKKTLVALAALAATGAFAQVTITGQLAMGYVQKTNLPAVAAKAATPYALATPAVAGGDYSGLGVDTSEIDFAATEDLGGGWKVAANMSLAGADRSGESGDGSVRGRNATLAVTTPNGIVTLGSVKAADYLSGGVAGLGAVWYGFDDTLFSARAKRDTLSYALPVGAFTFTVAHQEGADEQGLGSGAQGSVKQRLNSYAAKYAAGALVVDAAVLQYEAKSGGNNKDEQRLSASYDLGVAKLGGGLQATKYEDSSKKTQALLAATVPFGNLTLGGQYGNRKDEDAAGNSVTTSGYSLAAVYSLSKRTLVAAQYSSLDLGLPNRVTVTGLLLSHTF